MHEQNDDNALGPQCFAHPCSGKISCAVHSQSASCKKNWLLWYSDRPLLGMSHDHRIPSSRVDVERTTRVRSGRVRRRVGADSFGVDLLSEIDRPDEGWGWGFVAEDRPMLSLGRCIALALPMVRSGEFQQTRSDLHAWIPREHRPLSKSRLQGPAGTRGTSKTL